MEFKIKGNYNKSLIELKNNKNNSVASIFEIQNNNIGKLSNVIFTLKNNYAKKFGTTDASSNILSNFNPGYNSTILEKLFNQGAIIVATTNLDEFGLGGTGTYSNKGFIYHPKDRNYYVGGSSSGSASTFTENIGFAIGSDTGDSVRLPSSNIGKVGFKPSYGAVSRYGLFSYCSSMDTVAWFTHNVNDCAVLAQILFGKDKHDLTSLNVPIKNISLLKPKKIAYLNCFDLLEDYVKKDYEKLISNLKNQGIELIEIQPNMDLLNNIKVVYEIISFSEASSNLSNLNGVAFSNRKEGNNWEEIFTNTRSCGLGTMVQWRLILGSFFLEKENQENYFIRAQKVRRLISDWFNKIYEENDLLIFPSSPRIAPKIDNSNKTKDYKYMEYILSSSNLVGNPSLSIKLGENQENFPFNISLETKIYSDEKLLSYALYIEKLLGVDND